MSLDATLLAAWLTTHATAVVEVDRVLGFEPKSNAQIGDGTVLACWVANLRVIPERSTLAMSAGRADWTLRLHRNGLGDATEMATTERVILDATSALFAAYHAEINVSGVGGPEDGWFDPAGMTGEPISAPSGYMDIDKRLYRVVTISIGIVIDDAWPQSLGS